MLKYYKTNHDTKELEKITASEPDCWIDLVRPSDAEIDQVVEETKIDRDLLVKMRDDDELPRVETSGNAALVVIDVPALEDDDDGDDDDYITYPLGIIVTKDSYIITIAPVETSILDAFRCGKIRNFRSAKKT
jgi:magnesium transporter